MSHSDQISIYVELNEYMEIYYKCWLTLFETNNEHAFASIFVVF